MSENTSWDRSIDGSSLMRWRMTCTAASGIDMSKGQCEAPGLARVMFCGAFHVRCVFRQDVVLANASATAKHPGMYMESALQCENLVQLA
jgi:hypothetical protein